MLLFGVCFVIYFIKLSADKCFWTNYIVLLSQWKLEFEPHCMVIFLNDEKLLVCTFISHFFFLRFFTGSSEM
jgi:hypothetical protein